MSAPTTMTGKVTNFNAGKGFGFIQDSEGKDHFVHFSALKCAEGAYRGVAAGQEVEFEVTEKDGKTRAENVTAPGGEVLPTIEKPEQQQGGYGGGRGGYGAGRGGGGGYGGGRGGGGGYGGGRGGGRGFGGGRGRGGDSY